MNDKEFLNNLSGLGFKLMEPSSAVDANLTLARMVSNHDLRLWEGFPVVMANSAERNLFDYDRTSRGLAKPADRVYFKLLVLLSLALYQALGLKFAWAEKLYQSLTEELKSKLSQFRNSLVHNRDFKLKNYQMSGQRLKNTFNRYLKGSESNLNNLLALKSEAGLEYALSQVFSPGQKELFLKKLQGAKLTKTETEYFSRAVKKKVLALANPELHNLARKLLE
ncbi:MAG: hypothetical protein V1871_01255 [Planctomycetota bacterium]